MKTEKKKCCQDCKKGNPGKNESCKAKLMLEKIKNAQQKSIN